MALQLQGNPKVRWADRQLGRFLVLGTRPMRRKRTFPPSVETIGLLKLVAIGDTVLMSSIIGDLAERYPAARIVLFAGAENAPIAHLIPGITDIVTLPWLRPLRVLRTLRSWDLDLLFDCESWLRVAALYAGWSLAKYTVGFDTSGQGRAGLQDLTIRHSDQMHEVDNYRALVAAIGVPTGHPPRLVPSGVSTDVDSRRPFAVLHPWPSRAGGESRNWPTERWLKIGTFLAERGLEVILTGGSADIQSSAALCTGLREQSVRATDVAGVLPLPAVADLVAKSTCVVSVNTGLMHIAAALGVPTVGLNGPTAARRWGPVGDRAVSVDSTLPGCGFLNLGWEYKGHRTDCMDGISVDAVIGALHRLLDDKGGTEWIVAP